MENLTLFVFGVFVSLMLLGGFILTANEFKKMGENPGDYKDAEAYKHKDDD